MAAQDGLLAGWLGDMPNDFSSKFIELGRWSEYESGEIVYGMASDGTDLFGIARGLVRMHIAMNEQEQRVAHVIGPGFWFGEYEFILNGPRIIEMVAATDLRILRVSRRDFEQLAKSQPDAWKWIAALAAQHLTIAIGAADDLMLRSPEKRIAAVLLRLSGNRLLHPASVPFEAIPMTQQELSDAANMSRATAGRILRQLEAKGLISIEYGSLVIRDPLALAAILQG